MAVKSRKRSGTISKRYSGQLAEPIIWSWASMSEHERTKNLRLLAIKLRELDRVRDPTIPSLTGTALKREIPKIEEELRQRLNAIEDEKLSALLSHYEIPLNEPHAWRMLALALSREHVPGFRLAKSLGAPRKGGRCDAVIWLQIEWKLARNPGKSVLWAAANLHNEFPDLKQRTTEALRKAHKRASNSMEYHPVLANVREWAGVITREQFDALVALFLGI